MTESNDESAFLTTSDRTAIPNGGAMRLACLGKESSPGECP
jgi:hypothetical protein